MLYIDLEPEMRSEKIINIRQRTVDIVNIGSRAPGPGDPQSNSAHTGR